MSNTVSPGRIRNGKTSWWYIGLPSRSPTRPDRTIFHRSSSYARGLAVRSAWPRGWITLCAAVAANGNIDLRSVPPTTHVHLFDSHAGIVVAQPEDQIRGVFGLDAFLRVAPSLDHAGVHRAEKDVDDPDMFPRRIELQRPREAPQPVLARAVRRFAGASCLAGQRVDVDDDARLLAREDRPDPPDEQNGRDQIDIDHAAERLVGDMVEPLVGVDPRVVDERVHVSSRRRFCQPVERVFARQIAGHDVAVGS